MAQPIGSTIETANLVRSPLQDVLSAQPAVLIGLIAHIVGTPLQDDIVRTTDRLLRLGQDISGHLQGRPMYVAGRVTDPDGRPLADAAADVWHSDDQGFYDLQKFGDKPRYAGRGRFRSGEDGRFHFWTIRPSAYPIPNDGPVGKMLKAQNRHPFRPEHSHFVIVASGHRKLVTHIFAAGDQYLDSDVVFGVKKSLVEEYRAHHGGKAPDGRAMDGDWFSLEREFRLARLD